MKRNVLFHNSVLLITLVVSLSIGYFYGPELYAQEQTEETVYFTDGSIARGVIIHINREKIRIKQKDGSIIERPVENLYRFSSKRPFREIYEQALEYENRSFWNRYKD